MLHIKNLHKSYGAFEVLRGLEMNVNKGDIYGFLGKNGCGKTTTMNIVSNIIPKDSGEINFGKENCKIGYLPETPSMFTYMNLSLIHISEPTRQAEYRMPSSA